MKIIEVTTKRHQKEFIQFPKRLYQTDKNYIIPLDNVVNTIFDEKKNPHFQHGKCIRWLLYDETNQIIGRVAAFIDNKKLHQDTVKTGGMGFLDCINDQNVADLLFDTCKNWLQQQGIEAMEGPINFGENDQFWGLLVEGFQEASFGMDYHPPYYKQLFEHYGFEPYYEQVTNVIYYKKKGFTDRFFKIADWVIQKEGNTFEHLDYRQKDKYANNFATIYNQAWEGFDNFKPFNKDTVLSAFESMRPIAIPEFIWFAYVDGEPAAFMIMIPDVNQILKYLDGRMNLLGKLKFIWYKWRGKLTRTRIVVMGVVPKYQRHGLESAMIKKCYAEFKKFPQFGEVELSWVGDFNPKMEAIHKAAGAEFYKKHITYKYMFDRSRKVEKRALTK